MQQIQPTQARVTPLCDDTFDRSIAVSSVALRRMQRVVLSVKHAARFAEAKIVN